MAADWLLLVLALDFLFEPLFVWFRTVDSAEHSVVRKLGLFVVEGDLQKSFFIDVSF